MPLEKYRWARSSGEHRADGEDEVVDGQAEVEHGHAVGARSLRNKIGIGQDIAGRAQQAEDILGDVLEVLLCDVHRSSFSQIA